MSAPTRTAPESLLRALIVILCITLGGYLLYYFPRAALGNLYLASMIAALVAYLAGALTALAGSEKSSRAMGMTGLAMMGCSTLLLAVAQTEFFFLAFVALFAALIRVFFSLRSTLIAALCTHLLLALVFSARWQLDGIFFQTPLYVIFSLSSIVLTHLMIREAEANARLAALHERLKATQDLLTSNAVDRERLRISRDLHDSLGHRLSALSLQLEVAGHYADETARAPIIRARSIAKSLLSEVRDVVASLRAESGIGLPKSLEHLVASVHGSITLNIEADFSVSRSDVDEAIFRIVQEILTNYTRHSGAASLSIRLNESPDEWLVTAEESGGPPARLTTGSGLLGMRERVDALGGHLTLETESGLRHLVRIPKAAPP